MTGDFNQGFVQVTIDGRTLSDLSEFTEPEIDGSESSTIMAGGGRGIGQNFSTLANSGQIPIKVAYPTGDARFLAELAQSKRKVPFSFQYTDLTQFPDGEMSGFSCEGRLELKAHVKSKEPDARDYVFRFVGYTATFKNQPPLTVA